MGTIVVGPTDNYVRTDTAESSLVTATVLAVDRFGWTTFSAMVQKQISQTVNTATGAITTVHTVRMSPSHASQVFLQNTRCY